MIIILFPSCLFITSKFGRPVARVSRESAICKIVFCSCLASKQPFAFRSRAITYFYTRGENIKILSQTYNFIVVEITRILENAMKDNGKSNDIYRSR